MLVMRMYGMTFLYLNTSHSAFAILGVLMSLRGKVTYVNNE